MTAIRAFRLALAAGALGLFGLAAGCADAPSPAEATAAATLAARPADPAKAAALVARAASLIRPGSVVQTESRLGVPTFVWTRQLRPAALAAQAQAGALVSPDAAARAVLADHAPLYGLDDADIASAVVAGIDDRGTGPLIVKLRGERRGVEIFGEQLTVVMNRRLEPIALSGYLTGAATPAARGGGLDFGLTASAGAAAALGQQARAPIAPAQLIAAGTGDGYTRFSAAPSARVTLDEPIRVKPVYFHLADGLEAAYYAEVLAWTGAPPPHVLAADGQPIATLEAYAYVISARTGEVLFRKDLIADSAPRSNESSLGPGGFTYRVWADPITGVPHDTPSGDAVHPKVNPAPDNEQAGFVATSDVTLPNFPFSQNDPWLAPGSTETVGNNVDAFLNLFSPDGLGNPVAAPADPPTGDFRAQITAVDQFLHETTPDDNGALAEGRQGAIQQLFYDNNFLHDWYYDSGFDEAAGNAQTNNFGRGGAGGDSIKAQVQDFAGFNNANMLTPADGGRPRMRMYQFPSPANHLEVTAPGVIAAKYLIGISMTGTQKFDIATDIVRATFSNSPSTCTVTNPGALDGKIALFDFDNTDGVACPFSTRITRLHSTTNAVASVMVYTSSVPNSVANIINFNTTHTRPIATISWNTGQLIKAQLSVPATVTAHLLRAPDRDGSLDNQIVFHEWFHYASNRLVGNAVGLNTQQSAGMGEGWGDFNAMMLTVREDDTLTPSNATFNGAYALATHATSGVPYDGSANQGFYFGIRRYPYSTDLTRNPLTYKHIANGVALPVGPPISFGADGSNNAEVHNTGEVWTSMLWECYAGLLRDTLGATPRLSFAQAQDRMKRYLIAGLKVTPISATILEARDAVLAVAYANDPADYLACRDGFARRGAGPRAVATDRYTADNTGGVEDFTIGPDLTLTGATIDDTLGTCDDDGVVDHGEYGRLTVTLRNIGSVALSAPTATISTASNDVWYPLGNTIQFPALAPGASASASLRFAYLGTVTGIHQLDFQIAYTDPQMSSPQTASAGFRTNTDDIPASSATDTVEPAVPAWTAAFNPALGNTAPWKRAEATPLQHVWHVDDVGTGADQYLISPVMTVDGGGSVNLQLDHAWSFEFDGGGNYDGGVIEMSVNGGAFTDIGSSAYNGTILNYAGDVNPLKGRPGFVRTSGGAVHTSLTQAVAPGSTVQLRFRFGADGGGGASGWSVDNIAFTGVVETPFATLVADADTCAVVPTSADLAITVTDFSTVATAGSTVFYQISGINNGPDNIIGATVSDAFPAGMTCTWTCFGGGGGACTASGSGDLADLVTLPAGATVTYSASCVLPITTSAPTVSNTATIALPGPVNDPVPGNNSSTDVDTVVHEPALVHGSKQVSGDFSEGGTVTYDIVLVNDGGGPQADNPGNEFVDVLPAGLTLVSASADHGTAVASVGTNTVTWNGTIASIGFVAITIVATINATEGTTITNQGTFHYDSQGVGTNDASGVTDAFPCSVGLTADRMASRPGR